MYTSFYRSVNYNSPSVEMTHGSVNRWVNNNLKICIAIQWNIIQPQKGLKVGMYAKTYMNHKNFILIEVNETQKDLLNVEGGGNGKLLFNGYKYLEWWNDENILEMDRSDDLTTLWMYLMPLRCTLKNNKILSLLNCSAVH